MRKSTKQKSNVALSYTYTNSEKDPINLNCQRTELFWTQTDVFDSRLNKYSAKLSKTGMTNGNACAYLAGII